MNDVAQAPKFALPPEWASAVSGAVLEIQRLFLLQPSTRSGELATSRAVTGAVQLSTQASSFDLQRFAKWRLAAVRGDGQAHPSQEALASFESVLRELVVDNGPTPQVGATPSGSVEIQWLVEGNLLSAMFDESGAWYVLILDENEIVLLDEEVPPGPMPEELQLRLLGLLDSMSQRIVQRPHAWSARDWW